MPTRAVSSTGLRPIRSDTTPQIGSTTRKTTWAATPAQSAPAAGTCSTLITYAGAEMAHA